MEDIHINFRRSAVGPAYTIVLFIASSALLSSLQFMMSAWLLFQVVLCVLAVFEVRRFKLFHSPMFTTLKFHQQAWWLCADGESLSGELTEYYRCPLFIMLNWSEFCLGQYRSRTLLIWRDMVDTRDWHLLRVYLKI